MTYGFVKVAAAIPKTKVADCIYNTIEIEKLIREAGQKHINNRFPGIMYYFLHLWRFIHSTVINRKRRKSFKETNRQNK